MGVGSDRRDDPRMMPVHSGNEDFIFLFPPQDQRASQTVSQRLLKVQELGLGWESLGVPPCGTPTPELLSLLRFLPNSQGPCLLHTPGSQSPALSLPCPHPHPCLACSEYFVPRARNPLDSIQQFDFGPCVKPPSPQSIGLVGQARGQLRSRDGATASGSQPIPML